MHRADRIDLLVSFLMESGVKMVLDDLSAALDRGAVIRILTGNYLGITEPSALYLIKAVLGERAELRFFSDSTRSFHPKAYFFHYRDEDELFIGSSNLSRLALTSGIEWNYRLTRSGDADSYRQFQETFEELYQHHSYLIGDDELKRYSKSWHRPAVQKDLDRWAEEHEDDGADQRSQGQNVERIPQENESPDVSVSEEVILSDGTHASLHPGVSKIRGARSDAAAGAESSAEETRDSWDTLRETGEYGAQGSTSYILHETGTYNGLPIDGSGIDIDALKRNIRPLYEPRGPQIEALYALNESVAEGADRGLACMATASGKTFLAAFFSRPYQRVLFVAHRQEILNQAEQTFRKVRPLDTTGFFSGDRKDTTQDLIFASVESLGKAKYLSPLYFRPDSFNLIVYDETHHIAASQYQKILNYFHPQFMLGLTATPERMDGRDIYEYYDYNVPYELSLRDAINKGVLCPFHYYGIYDETDYSGLHVVHGQYMEEDLDRLYIGNGYRHDLILKYYHRYSSRRALGFCSSRKHAAEMAQVFCNDGIPAAAVVSGEDLYASAHLSSAEKSTRVQMDDKADSRNRETGEFRNSRKFSISDDAAGAEDENNPHSVRENTAAGSVIMDRKEALSKLRDGSLKVIFSVDMFNEGLDVPDVDMVLFLRPTQSPVVFLQQLGRGLRRAKNKPYLNVLDFIGNYQKAGSTPQLLCGDNGRTRVNTGDHDDPTLYPDDCIVNFDMRLIDLFKKMQEKSRGIAERIDAEFDRIRDKLGHIPSRMELFTEMDDSTYTLCLAHTAQNPFRKYLEYLHRRHLLTMEEQKIYDGIGREFLNLISTTSMTKVYKMPVLASFITEEGELRTEVTDAQVLKTWKDFFDRGTNWKDLVSGKGNAKTQQKSEKGDVPSGNSVSDGPESETTVKRSDYDRYRAITDRQHLSNIHKNPVHFLIESGKGMFIEKEGYAIAVRDDLSGIFQNGVFSRHYQDIIQYRTMDYFRRRYVAAQDDAVFLFEKPVDKSLLKDGFAIPRKAIDLLLKETKIDLQRGGKVPIRIELDGQIYAAQLTWLDFSSEYQDQIRVQVRYSRDSEICQRLNELYAGGSADAKAQKIRICAIGEGMIRLE